MDNQEQFEEYTQLVEQHLAGHYKGWTSEPSKRQDRKSWKLSVSERTIYLYVIRYLYGVSIRAVSPICHLPKENRERFYEWCLETNNLLWNCALALNNETIVTLSERPIKTFKSDDLDDIINRVSYGSDKIAERINSQFDVSLY
ncbi:MAG: hypothetical protein GF384_03815 [Elusimicrobia bacterium]|nr:hypothetical protein [Elusimicrobiota bacterium]MBD3412030.1 hypothetical protein [Elusimicrobiota bacterium]